MIYTVIENTCGKTIVQEPTVDVKTSPCIIKVTKTFMDHNVLIDPTVICQYQEGSLAEELYNNGYYVFSESGEQDSRYSLAINKEFVKIHNDYL